MRKIFILLLILSLTFIHISSAFAITQNKTQPKVKQKATIKTKKVISKSRITKAKSKTASRAESNIDLIIRKGSSVIGAPYSFGASGGGSFDCSGFTSFAFQAVQIDLPHSSRGQASLGVHVSRSDLKKGDLVIFNNPSDSRIGHVGIYIGDNNFIHASTSKGVTITSLSDSYYNKRYVGARRVIY